MTDRELRMLISSSQEEGFKALFQQYQNYVYSIVWSRLRNDGTVQDAEECISDIFTQIYLHYDDISDGSLQAYIGSVAKRTAIRYYRRLTNINNKISDDNEDFSDIRSDEDIQSDAENAQINEIIYNKIKELGEPDSTIIIHKFYYDRKSKDIAKAVNLSPIAVRVRLNRALKKLKKLLSDEDISI